MTEVRNGKQAIDNELVDLEWRSPSRVTEDRNDAMTRLNRAKLDVAVALWGDRGSQLRSAVVADPAVPGGGRPPGRPRIATAR
ncbi:hypothetical protein [Streptomyces sp. GQFP]|uniref:hypothetical protein n=1 Tax=Streptomyces sp. GQFP TaxID=2907545 RepID=UPI001F258C0A|nr:hypothetical protein [Streptomyces sp. GQFP]UIX32036.1 hypothetical protein LUX31_19435 [Streptomyces sp. GQFP]